MTGDNSCGLSTHSFVPNVMAVTFSSVALISSVLKSPSGPIKIDIDL